MLISSDIGPLSQSQVTGDVYLATFLGIFIFLRKVNILAWGIFFLENCHSCIEFLQKCFFFEPN